jgi:uncharacterized protein (TIGR03086 family)
MDGFEALAAARGEVERRLRLVQPDQWSGPTPCDEWDVRALVNHVVTVNVGFELLLRGASRAEGVAVLGRDFLGNDPLDAYARSAATLEAAFREPGALDQVVHHPLLDLPAAQLLDLCTGDRLLHGWDLARAIGADETLDSELVEAVWATMAPLADVLPGTGVFGTGASGEVDESSPLQLRLLDLTGRRP